jgi:type IV pilus assembly protein PilV
MNARRPLPGRQRGLSLMEVCVSMLLMSVAALGLAGLQTKTMVMQHGAFSRATLSPLLNDLSGRMRSNMGRVPGVDASLAGSSGMYAYSQTWDDQASAPSVPSKLCGTETGAVVCNAQERATYDMFAWRQMVRQSLPQGSVWMSGDATQGLDITLMWRDKQYLQDGTTNGSTTSALRTALTCESTRPTRSGEVLGQASLTAQTCCPAGAQAPAGVRCANFTLIP